ncbi:MAG: flagellar filament capping protein FliD [Zoogloeaceae bacterium]|jgi:flagellar hook-associated protein 2|nr:flagellar filament capping protein FliD [Zoogloeaceae bacterium]
MADSTINSAGSTFTSLGVGSGLDLEGLLSKLVAVERAPITAMQKQVSSYNTKISSLGTLSSTVSALQSAAKALKPDILLPSALHKFASNSGSVANEEIASVVVGPGAKMGSFELAVQQLASAQKSVSNAIASGATFSGKFTISFPNDTDNTRKIEIDLEAGSSLEALATRINQKNGGVTAAVIKVSDTDSRLVLTGQEGEKNAFKMDGSGLSGGSITFNAQHHSEAKDAKFSLDGISITSSSNTITGVLKDVTLTLKKPTATGEKTSLDIKEEHAEKLKSSLTEFVDAFNNAVAMIQNLGAYDPETKVAAPLQGNRVLRETQGMLSSLIFSFNPLEEDAMRLADLGISIAKENGRLELDSTKLAAAIASDPEAIARFVGEVGTKFDKELEKVVGLEGSIKNNTESLRANITNLDKRQEVLEQRLVAIEARYRKQFSALDTLMAKMSRTSSYLAQQIASLPKASAST